MKTLPIEFTPNFIRFQDDSIIVYSFFIFSHDKHDKFEFYNDKGELVYFAEISMIDNSFKILHDFLFKNQILSDYPKLEAHAECEGDKDE